MAVNPDSTTAPTNNGVLTKFIAQTQSNAPAIDSNGEMTWTEVYKGPYSAAKDILYQCVPNATTRANVIDANTSDFDSKFEAPKSNLSGDNSRKWIFKSAHVDQVDSGVHALVTFEWSSKLEEEQEEPAYTVWNLRSGSSQVNVLGYCTNSDVSSYIDAGDDGESYSSRIQTWWDQPSDTSILKPSYKFQSIVGASKIQELNKAEKAIAKKLQSGRNPVFHYPIIVRSDYYTGEPSVSFTKIDHIVTDADSCLSGCPYSLDGFTWLLTSIDSTYNTNTKMTVVTHQMTGAATLSGMSGWDENFYGNESYDPSDCSGRWHMGQVRTTT